MHIFHVSAERESGRLKDEMKRYDLERTDLREKLNIYEVDFECDISGMMHTRMIFPELHFQNKQDN